MRKGSFTAIIAASAVLLCGCGEMSDKKSKTVKMPDLCGMTFDEAVEEYDDLLTIKNSGDEYSAKFDEGEICYQSVDEGEKIEEGERVRVKISLGKESDKDDTSETDGKKLRVPDLSGMDCSDARSKYSDSFKIEVQGYEYSDSAEEQCVIAQEPASGKRLEKGGTIYVTLSKGKKAEELQMPNLCGLDYETACELYEGKLRLVKAAEEYSDSVPKGAIIKQSVKANKPVKKGEKVGVKVSLGKKNSTVAEVPLSLSVNDYGCSVLWANVAEDWYFNGEIIDFVFKVKDSAPSGEYDINFLKLDGSDRLAENPILPDETCDGKIFVSAEAKDTPDIPEGVFFMGLDYGTAAPGDEVVLHLRMQNNPGLVGLLVWLSYDMDVFECVDAYAVGEFAALQ